MRWLTPLFLSLFFVGGCGPDRDRVRSAVEEEPLFDPVALEIDGLVGFYPLEGNALDLSEPPNHGTVYGATATADRFGRSDCAMRFAGSDDHIALVQRAIDTSTHFFTVSLWFKTDHEATMTVFFEGEANGPGIFLRINANGGKVLAHARDAFTIKSEGQYNDGQWHHVALTASENNVNLWLDSKIAGESEWSEDFRLTQTPQPTIFGRSGEHGGDVKFDHYVGDLDDVAIFHRPLTGAELRALYKDGPNKLPQIHFTASPLGFDVTFDASASTDADGEITSYEWTFGDGTTGAGSIAEHRYQEPGIYQVSLEITDDEGATTRTERILDIYDPNDHSDAGPWPAEWAEFEVLVLDLVNIERGKGAVCGEEAYPAAPPVEMNGFLRLSSRLHSVDMATRKFFSHTAPDGTSPFDRMLAAGFEGPSPMGENIAAGQTTPKAVMNAWMNSPGHCRNIMSPGYGVLGVGYHYDAASPMGHYWTQNFGGGH